MDERSELWIMQTASAYRWQLMLWRGCGCEERSEMEVSLREPQGSDSTTPSRRRVRKVRALEKRSRSVDLRRQGTGVWRSTV